MRSTARWVTIALAGALALAACTGGEDDAATSGDDGDGAAVEDADRAAPDADTGGEQEAPGEPAGEDGAVTGSGTADALAGRMVIQRVDLTLASDDPVATIDDVTSAARRAGGFVADSNLRREDGVLQGSLTLRVPVERLDATLADIEQSGAEVVARQLSSDDVTGEYADVQAQLRNLRALETELLALLQEAREEGGTTDVLTVFDRIRTTRGEIEQLEGRQAVLDDLVALATIDVHVQPSETLLTTLNEELEEEPAAWSPGEQLEQAWEATLAVLRGTVNVLIWVAVTVLPLLAILLLPVLIIWLVLRRRRGGHGGDGDGGGAPATAPSGAPPAEDRQPVGAGAGRTGTVPPPPAGVPSSSAPDPEG